jgi:ribosomal protein S18 acetylase RimI-like enzyme
VDQYALIPSAPSLGDYLALRSAAGLSPRRPDQGRGALDGSWSFCHVERTDGTVVAMGRCIGDGGWYFHIADMATHPDHQRRGLGRRVLEWLLDDIRARAPDSAFVSLVADPPGTALYRSVGMRDVSPAIGMGMRLERPH